MTSPADAPDGYQFVKPGRNGGALFQPLDARKRSGGNGRASAPHKSAAAKTRTVRDWGKLTKRFTAAITPEQREELANVLGVSNGAIETINCGYVDGDALQDLRAGWDGDPPAFAYSFPERDGCGRIVGLSLRAPDGRKSTPNESKRGLIVPTTLKDRPDPVLIVEGASDVAACESMQRAAVGRPSNSGGGDALAALLDGRDVLVLGENDAKPSGAWPGRDGAKAIARRLASERGEPMTMALPPRESKDVRSWLQARIADGLDLRDESACQAAGAQLLTALQAAARIVKPEKKPSQAETLVRLALECYRIGVADGDEPFAVELNGPNVALLFRGSRDALRSALSREFRRRYRATPSASALADALTALQGEAHECAPEPVFLRLAEHDGAIVLDLGRADGRVVIIRPGVWEVVDHSPVLFRRTALTGELPEPERGGMLDELFELVNVTPIDRPLWIGCQVAGLMPGIPHAIIMLGGLEGSGKTTSARIFVHTIDPSPAPVRSQPKDPEQWAMAASGSWVVAIDNVSAITDWWSDALCKAVTGDGWIRRRLYTDSELSVLSFRRVIVLTSIDAGALRGDLGSRIVMIDLERIPRERRRPEKELDAIFVERAPRILGALFDLTAAVLAELPRLTMKEYPRMADFARVLAAVDAVLGTNALATYEAQGARVASEVIEADPVGGAVVALVEREGSWEGTATDLLGRIKPENPGREWPKNGRGLSGRLRRLIPALLVNGVRVTPPEPSDKSRRYVLETIAPTAQPPENGQDDGENGENGWAVENDDGLDRPANRPSGNKPGATDPWDSGLSGDSGGCSASPSISSVILDDPEELDRAKAAVGIDKAKAHAGERGVR